MCILTTFLDDCRIRGLSPKTIKLYESKLAAFIGVTPKISNWPTCQAWLMETYPNPRTRHQVYRIIRTYIRWQVAAGLCPTDWISGRRMPCPAAAPTPILEQADFEKLLAQIPRNTHGRRDRAYLIAIYYTGTRRDAMRLLTWDKIDLKRAMCYIKTKGGKEQCIHIPKAAALEINAWKLHCPSKKWVFPSARRPNKAIDDHAISRRCRYYGHQAGLGRVYLHLLRHSFATRLARATGDVTMVQEALGHASASTSMVYIRRAKQASVNQAIDKLFEQ